MKRFFALALALCAASAAQAASILVGLEQLQTNFTSTLTPAPTDIWLVRVLENANTDPVFSFDLAIPGTFVQSVGAPTVANTSGPILVAGVLPAADTYFSVPNAITPGNIAIAPGTATDSAALLEAAYTITGATPILQPGQIDVILATLAVPAGTDLTLPELLGTAAVRTATGPVAVDVISIPEPSTVLLAGLASVGFLARRK